MSGSDGAMDHALVSPYLLEGRAVVRRLPNSARRRGHEEGLGRTGNSLNVGYAPAHVDGSNGAPPELFEELAERGGQLGLDRFSGDDRGEKDGDGGTEDVSVLHWLTGNGNRESRDLLTACGCDEHANRRGDIRRRYMERWVAH